ncbi:hypothetical protein N7476_005104 [Penicillium atrosanguineum]|uniref:Uncharacterized protein n=1 Tax=Penicillium atrosanguineum TaxID=1132637 RepID=A0A9W9U561_9EURO|nr:hypothetical protein N7476_005104 [Penicillium atrosanguineum]
MFGTTLMRDGITENKQDLVRVAITSTTFDSKLCLFRSYGDVLREGERGDYISQSFLDLRLWQAVATSCAAPLMFEPPSSAQEDVFDGLFAANCPAWVAMMEMNKLSMLGTRLLDFSVSFGTGQFLSSGKNHSRNWLKYIIPEWIQRVGCCLGNAVDADSMYERFSQTLDSAERDGKHHRVEPCFTRSPIAPDDPAMLQDLATETDSYMKRPSSKAKSRCLQLAMLASCFYAALVMPPTFDSKLGQYCARLAILSRWPEDDAISNSLGEKLDDASFLVNSLTYNYQPPLHCTVYLSSLDVPIEIRLTLDGKSSHPISGFPLSVTQLVYLQRHPTTTQDEDVSGWRG